MWPKVVNPTVGNGIAVNPPKVFDSRSLVLKLEDLDSALARLSVIDQAKLVQGIGVLQGVQQTSVERNLTVSTIPLPSIDLTEKRDTNTSQLVETDRVTKTPAYTPAQPTFGSGQVAPTTSGTGIAAQDLLSEQMNLTYQIVNLRMLLERSITDRIQKTGGGAGAGTRAQAVLGFKVNIDPMRQHRGYAAVVEIQLTTPRPGAAAPSLISMMPQTKTYNVAALSKKSNAFSAAAAVNLIAVGAGVKSTSESYFLYRDTDTVAIQRPTPPDKLMFGWTFRPVLNREAIEPGERELFAVIGLDELDSLNVDSDFNIGVSVRTYWAKYDKKAGLIASGPYDERNDAGFNLDIPRSRKIQNVLGPKVQSVTTKAAGISTVLLDVTGENFFSGLTAIVGEQILEKGNRSLLIKSDQYLQIAVDVRDVLKGNVYLSGRYGLSTPVLDNAAIQTHNLPDLFEAAVGFSPGITSRKSEVKVKLHPKSAVAGAAAPDLKGRNTIISIGPEAFVVESSSWRTISEPGAGGLTRDYLQTVLTVNPDTVKNGTVVNVVIPFVGADYFQTSLLTLPVGVEKIVLLREGDHPVLGIVGWGFDSSLTGVAVVLGNNSLTGANGLTFRGGNLISFEAAPDLLKQVKNAVVTLGALAPVILPIPAEAVPSPVTKISNVAPPGVAVDSATVVELPGENLDQVGKVKFAKEELVFAVTSDKKTLRVFLTRDVTAKAGNVALVIETKSGKILDGTIKVQ